MTPKMIDQDETSTEQEPDEPQTEPTEDEQEAEDEANEQPAEPEQEESSAKSEQDIEKANRALEREATAHANRISRIMGEDAQGLVSCERCWPLAPGFHWPPDVAPVEDDQRAAVLASLGMGDGAVRQLRDASGVHECEKCGGWGMLAFPTKVPHVQEQTCPTCQGSGYVLNEQAPAPTIYLASPTQSTAGAAAPVAAACPLCGQAGMAGQPHWCAPAATG